MQFGHWYYAGLIGAGLLFVYQQWLIRKREPQACLRAFQNNALVGMAVFLGILLHYVYTAE
jgi:4-hydroxybenzoate polyprenyltransferase